MLQSNRNMLRWKDVIALTTPVRTLDSEPIWGEYVVLIKRF